MDENNIETLPNNELTVVEVPNYPVATIPNADGGDPVVVLEAEEYEPIEIEPLEVESVEESDPLLYQALEWQNYAEGGTKLNKDNLDNIEQGILKASKRANELDEKIAKLSGNDKSAAEKVDELIEIIKTQDEKIAALQSAWDSASHLLATLTYSFTPTSNISSLGTITTRTPKIDGWRPITGYTGLATAACVHATIDGDNFRLIFKNTGSTSIPSGEAFNVTALLVKQEFLQSISA